MSKLLEQYQDKFGYYPNINDFVCTKDAFTDALQVSLNKGVHIYNLIPQKNKVKNQALINSLHNKTSQKTKTSSAETIAKNRTDRAANQNLNQIKHNGIVNPNLQQDNIVSEVNELRTVQSNKRIKKTRKTVIVRHNKEHKLKTALSKVANLFSFVAVGLAAVFLGIFAGNMIIANKTLVSYDYNEADYLPNYSAVYTSNSTKAPNSVLPTNAYIMAEWALANQSGLTSGYTIKGSGFVSAKVAGIQQKQVVVKNVEKTADYIISENITNGLIPAAEITKYNFANNTIESFVTTEVAGEPPVATYKSTPTTTYNLSTQLQDYRTEYGISPDTIFAQIVSDKTVTSGKYLGEDNGKHTYEISLHNVYSVINYVYLMMHMSGLERPPTFESIKITFTVDSNYRFTELKIEEKYQIYYLGLPADCTAETTYTVSYN